MSKLGILVVGQSPRPEVEAEFRRLVEGVDLDLRGCLDGLTRAEIDALEPTADDFTLFTRLPNGDSVSLPKSAVVRLGATQLDALEETGVKAVVVLCTGEFPAWENRPVLLPSKVMRSIVLSLQPRGHLGVFSPLESQLAHTRQRWSGKDREVTAIALSPNASAEEARNAGNAMAEARPDLLVLDCVSYRQATKQIVCTAASRPGILAITAIARIAAELIEGV